MSLRRKSSQTKLLITYYCALLEWLVTTGMHIPDGYLSPITSLIMILLVLPFWIIGLRKIRQTMSARSVPLIALIAAFSFVIMMFNFPLPGGTTGHAVGATLAAIVLGPEIATIAVSIALIIQALFFGDGGILAIGANCFNMAIVIPYISYALYRLVSKNTPLTSHRRLVGAAVGGWVGVTAGAFFAGFEFGIQPLLFKTADGSPMYAPYPLSVAIPAMVIPHMAVASLVEGVLTALVVAYLQHSNLYILENAENREIVRQVEKGYQLRWLWAGLVGLVIVSPLGLLAPGTAWGEWGIKQLRQMGFQAIPSGLEKLSGLWGAPFTGYKVSILGNASLGYILSALLGIFIIGTVISLFTMLLTARSTPRNPEEEKPTDLHGSST